MIELNYQRVFNKVQQGEKLLVAPDEYKISQKKPKFNDCHEAAEF